MTRHIIILIFSLMFIANLFGQSESNYNLTQQEIEYLNSSGYNTKDSLTLNFENKRTAFFTGPAGTTQVNKKVFFNSRLNTSNDEYISIIKFNDREKAKHGIDFAVIFESKNPYPNINNQLKKNRKKERQNP